jgi:hypothetical protein
MRSDLEEEFAKIKSRYCQPLRWEDINPAEVLVHVGYLIGVVEELREEVALWRSIHAGACPGAADPSKG